MKRCMSFCGSDVLREEICTVRLSPESKVPENDTIGIGLLP